MVARDKEAAKTQRQRWESGRRGLKKTFAKKILSSPALRLREKAIYFLDLIMPPLTIIMVAVFGVFIFAVSNYLLLGDRENLSLALIIFNSVLAIAVTLYLLSPLVIMKIPGKYLWAGIYFPAYAIWKALIFLKKSPQEWVRTNRDVKQ